MGNSLETQGQGDRSSERRKEPREPRGSLT